MKKAQKFIDQYLEDFIATTDKWNYEDGCVLRGAQLLYQETEDKQYFNFIENYLKNYISEDGEINHYNIEEYNIDKINCGKVLLFMFNKTKEEKYLNAAKLLRKQLDNQPRCKCGSFFHKAIYPYQVWLDGVYMGLPFLMEIDTYLNNFDCYEDIKNQLNNTNKYLYDTKKHLHYHAYDETHSIFWADKKTGCSKNFWLRSIGWHTMALVDIISIISTDMYLDYRFYIEYFRKTLDGILEYQDTESKLFYQVVDKKDYKNNYLETSGSLMIAYSIFKACNLRIIDSNKYFKLGEEIFESIINTKLKEESTKLVLKDNCSVAGLGPKDNLRRDGTIEYYLSEPITDNDKKSVGTFLMAYSQYLKYNKSWKYINES